MGGLRRGLAAGAGAATVDLLFCSLALLVGGLLNQLLSVALVPLQVLAGGVLISIGVRGLLSLRASSTSADAATDPRVRGSAKQLYLRFIALTAMNPATILYFLALAIGLQVSVVTRSTPSPSPLVPLEQVSRGNSCWARLAQRRVASFQSAQSPQHASLVRCSLLDSVSASPRWLCAASPSRSPRCAPQRGRCAADDQSAHECDSGARGSRHQTRAVHRSGSQT